MRRRFVTLRFLLILALLVATATARRAFAEDVEEDGEEVAAIFVAAQPVWTDAQFDQWVFQHHRTKAAAHKNMLAQLSLQAQDVDRVCSLSESQRKKLQLAGRGDIKRFFDRYEVVKRKFQLIKNDQQKFNQIWQDISPLQVTMQTGLFHDDSFLHKSLKNTLNSEQFKKYDTVAEDRRAFRHRAKIELTVTLIEQGMPLTADQRQELIEFFVKETKPAKKSGQYDYYLILYQVSKLPKEKLQVLLDKTQLKVLNQQLDQSRGMEQWLKQSGYLPDEDEDAEE